MLDGTERDPLNPTYTCGKDDMKRAVYNMKESIEEGDRNIKKNKEYSEESLRNRRTEFVSKKN